MKTTSLDPNNFNNNIINFTIKGFGFCAKDAPVNDATKGYWFLIIDNPGSDNWSYIKFMMFNGIKKEFSMYAYREYFKEITKGNFVGQLVYTQESRDGINDTAYLFLKQSYTDLEKVSVGVYVV